MVDIEIQGQLEYFIVYMGLKLCVLACVIGNLVGQWQHDEDKWNDADHDCIVGADEDEGQSC